MIDTSLFSQLYGDYDDLYKALHYNHPKNFSVQDLAEIVAEVPGANDELSWWWILRTKENKYILLQGACDYTGWDCQSGVTEEGIFNSAKEAAVCAPFSEEYSGRNIYSNLLAQVLGTQPKFTYYKEV